ncbi:MAG: CBS domain-containing protein [Nitrososphaerota archaeon]|nr:CBS domain-containing protein [Nitrososphaerota archaeon]MDG6923230.1 CBS domain-containing protein [Nitrososphaerota archaeon]
MDKSVITLPATASVENAIETMTTANVWSLVVERQGLPVGVVTDRDILRRCLSKRLRPDSVKLEEVMSSPLITISPEAQLGEVMQRMAEKAIRRLYVVQEGKIIGRITQTMLFENSTNTMMALSSMRYHL